MLTIPCGQGALQIADLQHPVEKLITEFCQAIFFGYYELPGLVEYLHFTSDSVTFFSGRC
jgi:hypothetical protein